MQRGLIILLSGLTLLHSQVTYTGKHQFFEPSHRLSGIGVDRAELSDAVIAKRTELMIESQTFGIMRDPRVLAGVQRVTTPKLQKVFAEAARQSGLTPSLIAAEAFLESFGDPNAQSPSGPRGIMQFSQATARAAGLKVVMATRYRTVSERKKVKVNGRMVAKTVSHKTPYEVLVRDDRLDPELAVPAAANYLARMQTKYGGIDLAIFAYHCGEGCVADFISLARQSADFKKQPITVSRLFFTASPVRNVDIYQRIKEHMLRDYSPTYYFRVRRAEELISLYKQDPDTFKDLLENYKNPGDATKRANDRLTVWLKPQDVVYKSCEDLRREEGKGLAKVDSRPAFLGFQLRTEGPGSIGSWDLKNRKYYQQASPAAIGTLAYISFETRRLFEAMKTKGEKFEPLEVTALVRTLDMTQGELSAHCTGQVFDIAYADLPPHEKEALDFILEDLGWDGYLGFVQEMTGTMHIGCSPSSRDFFNSVYHEMIEKTHES
jgi:hypothetical protein